MRRFEFVIVGGGVMGCSTAYHLALAGRAKDACVIEPDPTYEFAATPRAVGSVRRVHGLPENVRMSQFGSEFYGSFGERMAVDGDAPNISYRRQGYTFMVWGKENVTALEVAWRMQTSLGAPVRLIDRPALKSLFPSLTVDDVDAAAYSPEDGWIDPHAALTGLRRKARSLGVEFIHDRVVGLEAGPKRVERVVLQSGASLDAGFVVNVANCWAPEICAMVGMKVPIQPMRRQTFYFEIRDKLESFGITRDFSGLSFRPEGNGYVCGVTHVDEPRGFNWTVDDSWFEDAIWPRLAHRVQAFEALKQGRSWSGHYDQNDLDGNPIIGPWTGGLDNFYVAAGFSGHGLQHAPAVGRALKELLVDGGFRTIDLARLSYRRIIDNAPLIEVGGPPA